MIQANGKKVTMATIKAFVRKNLGKLYIRCRSRFDGIRDPRFVKATDADNAGSIAKGNTWVQDRNLGIQGAWFVGSSRDYFQALNVPGFEGYEVSNSCGSFDLAIKV